MSETPQIRSLIYATDVDVLAADRRVTRGDRYWRIESPSNPAFWWGNFLLYDTPPQPGDGDRWPADFRREFPQAAHMAFGWDSPDGDPGAAVAEFPAPYAVELSAGLIASAGKLVAHPRANDQVHVQALDPRPGADRELWDAVLALQLEQMLTEDYARELDDANLRGYRERRNRELRELFCAGRGAWYVALHGGTVAASLGIVVTDGRARYQSVDTVTRFRRRGIATRLVVEAGLHAARQQTIDHYVIVADPDYHAIGIYESVGFRRVERACGVQLRPQEAGVA